MLSPEIRGAGGEKNFYLLIQLTTEYAPHIGYQNCENISKYVFPSPSVVQYLRPLEVTG